MNGKTSAYIHGTDADEQKRLSLLNELLNQRSLAELALRGDENVIDFGSGLGQFSRAIARAVPHGSVVGIERSGEQIRTARELAADAGESELVEFRQDDVMTFSVEAGHEGRYDVAHTRFLLEHLPDPLPVVQLMVRSVRPGGRIVLADDDYETLRVWPEPPGLYELWRAFMRANERLGNDPYTGRRLVQLLHQAGAEPVRNTLVFFGACAGMDSFPAFAGNLAGVLRGARESIVNMNLFDAAYFDDVMGQLNVWAKRPDASLWFTMCWAEGRRPS